VAEKTMLDIFRDNPEGIVIEGAYFFENLVHNYDEIIVLRPYFFVCIARIWRRFVKEPDRGFDVTSTVRLTRQILKQYYSKKYKRYKHFRYKVVEHFFKNNNIDYQLVRNKREVDNLINECC
jgi:hypothetical protein